MRVENILLLQEYFRNLKSSIPTVQFMQLRVYLFIAALLEADQRVLIIAIAISFLMWKCDNCLRVIKVALYKLLLYFYIVFVKSFIIIYDFREEVHCFFHIALIVGAHCNFHSDLHFSLTPLNSLTIALLRLFIFFHFLIGISKEFLGSIKFHKILVSSLTFVHQEIGLASHQVRVLKVRENRDAIRDRIQRFFMVSNFALNNRF